MSVRSAVNTDNVDLAKELYTVDQTVFDNENLDANILSWLITVRPSILLLPHHPLTTKAFDVLEDNNYDFNLAPDYLDSLIWIYNKYEEPHILDLISRLLYSGYSVNWDTVDRFHPEIDLLLQYYDPHSEYNI